MAHSLIFYGTTDSTTDLHNLHCFVNHNGEIFIEIEAENDYNRCFICLDKPTAIKFAKTLRTEINKIDEVYNG